MSKLMNWKLAIFMGWIALAIYAASASPAQTNVLPARSSVSPDVVPSVPLKPTSVTAETPASLQLPTGARVHTYYSDVQPIVARHCVSCHQDGGSAPFSLTTYRDVSKRAPQIAQAVSSGYMPPWKPDSHGELEDENRLSGSDIDFISQWSDSGTPEGTENNIVSIQPASDGSQFLSKPDLVLSPLKPVDISADGPDFYQCYVLPTHLKSEKYLSAIVFQPGNLHTDDHALEYLDVCSNVRSLNSVVPGGGFTVNRSTTGLSSRMVIGAWGISTKPRRFPDGTGILVPEESDIVLEVHYHSTGKPEQDLPKLLLYFCKGAVERQVRVAPVMVSHLRIDSNMSMSNIGGQRPIVSNISIISVIPYMRSRGRSIRLGDLLPDKTQHNLFNIPSWDFDWIGNYWFKAPVRVPQNSLLAMTAVFGGSHGNSTTQNQNNSRVTTWGDSLDDETAVVYVFYTTDREHQQTHDIEVGIPEIGGANNTAMNRILLSMFDVNKDGHIDQHEYSAMRAVFGPSVPRLTGMDMM